MTEDELQRLLESLAQRVETLRKDAQETSPSQMLGGDASLLVETLEELRLAQDGLRQQNDQLTAARQAVEAERRHYHELFPSVPAAYLLTDLKGVVREADQAAAALLGTHPGLLVGKPLITFVPNTDHQPFRAQLERAVSEGWVKDWPLWLEPHDGELLLVNAALTALREPTGGSGSIDTGEPVSLRWLIHNTTREAQAEQALRESEEKYRNLVERASDGICIIHEGILQYANPRLAQMWGGGVEELLDTLFSDYVHPDDLPVVADRHARRIAGEDVPSLYEARLLRKDGSVAFVELNIGTIRYQGARALMVIVRDITRRRRAEDAARRHVAELEALREVGLAIAAELNVDALFHLIVSQAIDLLDADSGGLYVYRPNREVLERVISVGSGLPVGTVLRRGEGLSGKVWDTRQALIVEDYQRWEGRAIIPETQYRTFGSVLGVPIEDGSFRGVLVVAVSAGSLRVFSPDDATLLSMFGTQAAIAMANAQLHAQVRQHSETLEERVRERTAALRQANAQLLGEIAERERTEEELKAYRGHLEELVQVRTRELQQANTQLRHEIVERERVEDQIRIALQEKEVLLQEVHHRVKNNMQVIASLLDFQAMHAQNPAAQAAFEESQRRIQAMARIHEQLYLSHDIARVDMAHYIQSLASYLQESHGMYDVTFSVEVGDVMLDLAQAIPCGLMVSELISNALKHAFPPEVDHSERRKEIRVALTSAGAGRARLVVRDNGIGLPRAVFQETIAGRRESGLGLKLASLMAQQLRGSLELETGEGTRLGMTFTTSGSPQA